MTKSADITLVKTIRLAVMSYCTVVLPEDASEIDVMKLNPNALASMSEFYDAWDCTWDNPEDVVIEDVDLYDGDSDDADAILIRDDEGCLVVAGSA